MKKFLYLIFNYNKIKQLSKGEKTILSMINEKYGFSLRDKIFFVELSKKEAWVQVWGNSGNGPMVSLTNLYLFLTEGVMTEEEIKNNHI